MNTNRDWISDPMTMNVKFNLINAPPINDISKCPAIIFAVNRKVKAKGRIKFLNISTTTINLINANGVPVGIKCVKKFFKKFIHLKIIIPNQNEKERGKVTITWEVKENKNGKRARKLKIKIIKKIEIINK